MAEQNQQKHALTTETVLYLLAFALALALRLFRLGNAPLTDFEAKWALQAWDTIQGSQPLLGPQPAYVTLTSALFFLVNGLNSLARLLPAVAGSLLVFLPWLLKPYTTGSPQLKRAGVILAFFLALDPGLVALSRTAGSIMPALSFGLLTLGCLAAQKPRLAGVFAALALLSGPALLEGLLGIGLAWLAARLLVQAGWLNPPESLQGARTSELPFGWKKMLYFGLGTFLVVGTGLLIIPQGIAAFASTISAYLTGWVTPAGIPALRIVGALVFYQPLAVVFGLVGALVAWINLNNPQSGFYFGRLLSLWALMALFTALIYPGHEVSSAAWALIPLWGLASLSLAGIFPEAEENFSLPTALGHAGLISFFLLLAGHNLLRLESLSASLILYVVVVGGIFLMAAIVTILVTAGWSVKTALWGLSWGITAVLMVLMFSITWKTAFIYPNGANELWTTGPAAGQMDALVDTITDLSWWNKSQSHALDLVITADAPSLRWALRFFPDAQYKTEVASPETPSVIITVGSQQSLSLPSSYRGQSLVLRETPSWTGVVPDDLIRWVAFRQAPKASENLILWARNDLFPGGNAEQTSTNTP
jgi:hypothetical protein